MASATPFNCLICNASFPEPLSLEFELKDLDRVFFLLFKIPSDKQGQLSFKTKPNTNPFCEDCTKIVKQMKILQMRYELIENQLHTSRDELVQKISNSFAETSKAFDYFHLKSEIFMQFNGNAETESAPENDSSDTSNLPSFTTTIIKNPEPQNSQHVKKFGPSRELFMLTKKDKGDRMIISVDQENTDEITCQICTKICRSKENLVTHMKSHENISLKLGKISGVKKDKSNKTLISEVQENAVETTCQLCNKMYKSKEKLITHMKFHESNGLKWRKMSRKRRARFSPKKRKVVDKSNVVENFIYQPQINEGENYNYQDEISEGENHNYQKAPEPKYQYETVELQHSTVPDTLTDGLEVDRWLIKAAQQMYPFLRNMNFNLKLVIEKFVPGSSPSHWCWNLLKDHKKTSPAKLNETIDTFHNSSSKDKDLSQPSFSANTSPLRSIADSSANSSGSISFLNSKAESEPAANLNIPLPDNWRLVSKDTMIRKTPGPKSAVRLDALLSKPITQIVSPTKMGKVERRWTDVVGITSAKNNASSKLQSHTKKLDSAYWADASNIISSSEANASTIRFMPTLSEKMVKGFPSLKSPQSKLPSIKESFKQTLPTSCNQKSAQSIRGITRKYSGALKPNVKSQNLIKEEESPHIIESTHSLAPQPPPHRSGSGQKRKAIRSEISSEVTALLKNTNVSVSVANQSEYPESQTGLPGNKTQPSSIPPGIKFISVEDVLKGKTFHDSNLLNQYASYGKFIMPKPSPTSGASVKHSPNKKPRSSAFKHNSTPPNKPRISDSGKDLPLVPSSLCSQTQNNQQGSLINVTTTSSQNSCSTSEVVESGDNNYAYHSVLIQETSRPIPNFYSLPVQQSVNPIPTNKPFNLPVPQSGNTIPTNKPFNVPAPQSGNPVPTNEPFKIVLGKKILTSKDFKTSKFINPPVPGKVSIVKRVIKHNPGNRRYKAHEMANIQTYSEFLQNKNLVTSTLNPSSVTSGNNANVVTFFVPLQTSINSEQILNTQTFTTNVNSTTAGLGTPVTIVPASSIQPQSVVQPSNNVNPYIKNYTSY